MANNAPIGVFDSGVGGLSVLHEIRSAMPDESLIYLADTAHVPYGDKDEAFVYQRCIAVTDFLLAQGIKALVVACNTATAAAVSQLRQDYPDLPIIGMEPAIKPAVTVTRNGVIGVLATTGTLRSHRFASLLKRYAAGVEVKSQACPGLADRIEAGELDSAETRSLLLKYVEPLISSGCDTVVLGCTHYPFLRPLLQELLPADIAIVDTGAAVARRVKMVLQECQGFSCNNAPSVSVWASGSHEHMARVLPTLWGSVDQLSHWGG